MRWPSCIPDHFIYICCLCLMFPIPVQDSFSTSLSNVPKVPFFKCGNVTKISSIPSSPPIWHCLFIAFLSTKNYFLNSGILVWFLSLLLALRTVLKVINNCQSKKKERRSKKKGKPICYNYCYEAIHKDEADLYQRYESISKMYEREKPDFRMVCITVFQFC